MTNRVIPEPETPNSSSLLSHLLSRYGGAALLILLALILLVIGHFAAAFVASVFAALSGTLGVNNAKQQDKMRKQQQEELDAAIKAYRNAAAATHNLHVMEVQRIAAQAQSVGVEELRRSMLDEAAELRRESNK